MAPHPAYVGYRAASTVSRLLPAAVVPPLTRFLGRLGPHVMGDRAAMVERHQRRVRPNLDDAGIDAAVVGTFESYVHYWLESFRLPGTDAATIDAGFTVDGYEHIDAGIDAGKGVILALPHLGGWEWAGFWLTAIKHLKVSCVAEMVDPPELADWFIDLRNRFGLEIIPLDSSAGTRSTKALAANHVLCLLCDRDLSGTGIEVEFFGERTTLPGGPATIAIRSGAPLLPTGVFFDDDGRHHGVVRPPIDTSRRGRLREDVTRVTQELATELETLIRMAPEQWHLLQPNWPSDRPDAASGSPTDPAGRAADEDAS